jgi:succinoglycan biosynthesis transport protein ExoP
LGVLKARPRGRRLAEDVNVSMINRKPASPAGARPAGVGRHAPAPEALRIDTVEVGRLLRTHWRLFRNVALSTIGVALVVAALLPANYSSSAVVMVEPRKNNVTDLSAVLSETPTDPASLQNQIQLLTSRDLAERVVDKLGLVNDPDFQSLLSRLPFDPLSWLEPSPVPGAPSAADRHYASVVNVFIKHLTVDANGLSTTISVSFSSPDPVKAARIANAVVDTYIDTEAAVKYAVTQRTTAWLIDRIRELGQQVQIADANVQLYKTEHDLNDTPMGGPLVDQQLAAINAQLVAAREDLATKQAESDHVTELLKTGRAADVSQIVSSQLIVQLREQQADAIRQEALLTARYGARNPKLIAAESQRRDLDAKIEQEVERIAGSVQNDLAVARVQVGSLEASLRQVENQATGDNMARVKLASLEANASSTRTIYESFVTRLREAQGQDILEMADARVISHAPVPLSPSWLVRALVALGSIPIGMLLGFLAALLAERRAVSGNAGRMQSAVAMPQDPLRGVPVLARFSGMLSSRSADFIADQPNSPFARAMRTLAQRVVGSRYTVAPKIIAVTSVNPRDGQTAVAVNLARAASQFGLRVLLVDGNLQAPAIGSATRLPVPGAGMVEVLSGTARLSQSLVKDPRSNVLILSVVRRYADPRAIWASPAMQRLMAHLRQVSDLVIVDAAPMANAHELPWVARLSDALIVVAAGAPRAALTAALDHLDAIAAPPVGIVFTR